MAVELLQVGHGILQKVLWSQSRLTLFGTDETLCSVNRCPESAGWDLGIFADIAENADVHFVDIVLVLEIEKNHYILLTLNEIIHFYF